MSGPEDALPRVDQPGVGLPEVEVRRFADLDVATAYACWRLRQDVFVVEQDCPYADLDGRDLEPGTRHLVLRESGGGVVGTLRVLDDGAHDRVGRVVLARSARGQGLAARLMEAAVSEVGDRPSVLDAQAPLASFYAGFGYVGDGPEFVEDGILHLPMRRPANRDVSPEA